MFFTLLLSHYQPKNKLNLWNQTVSVSQQRGRINYDDFTHVGEFSSRNPLNCYSKVILLVFSLSVWIICCPVIVKLHIVLCLILIKEQNQLEAGL